MIALRQLRSGKSIVTLQITRPIFLICALIILQASSVRAQWTTNSNDVYKTNTAGNVGIGTTAPGAKLDVKDTNNFQVTPNQSGAGELPTSVLIDSAGAGLSLLPDGNGAAGPKLFLGYRDTATPMWRSALEIANTSGFGNLLLMKSGGNVGIGTSDPSVGGSENYTRLTVQASDSTAVAGGIFNSGSGQVGFLIRRTGTTPSRWYQYIPPGSTDLRFYNGSDLITLQSGGNVGIGTTSPASPGGFAKMMHLLGASNASYVVDAGGTSRAEFGVSATGGWLSTGDNLPFRFATNNVERMRIDASGNVGIGTSSTSTYKLDVNGTLNASGTITGSNIIAKYQDVAEWVPASHALPVGTVVTLDPTKSNHVEASTHAYDTRVAGVVSAQPGITLGEQSDSKVLVATTGRVKVMVDASSGPIGVGDLLVTSDIAGVAKKSEPLLLGGVPIHRPGTLIGKALEPLVKGRGEILVLLSLQ
jgi:hypothetical protein